jgi:CheY-like chemotaxis protein
MQPATASALGGAKQPTRILIVDDHEISRAALRALLRTEGIDVADVGTGDAAITAAIAFHPDVVIVDVTPADPAGFRITRQLRALPDAPAVVLTSSTSRCRFGSQLDHYPFVAKADLCARAIENAQAPPLPRSEEGHHASDVQRAVQRAP